MVTTFPRHRHRRRGANFEPRVRFVEVSGTCQECARTQGIGGARLRPGQSSSLGMENVFVTP